MRWSRTLIPTLREVPTEAVAPSHRLMLRAGLIQQVAAGAYSYLPLGWRVLRKVSEIVRQEMDRAGAVEVLLPSLQPIEWWEQTGRRAAYGDNLFVVRDRHGREQALGPTHEEVITKLIDHCVHSYRQLPLTLYQIQTKFRDEFRPRFGVLRSREFQMKDAYSFHLELESLDATYEAMYEAYCRIFERCGLPYVTVEAESGPIGGSASHEFMVPSPTGEDVILSSDRGNYAANVEKAEIGGRAVSEAFAAVMDEEARGRWTPGFADAEEPTGELEKVHTPDCATIDDVSQFMKVKPKHMLKTLCFKALPLDEGEEAEPAFLVVAVVRGDHELNVGKLKQAVTAAAGVREQFGEHEFEPLMMEASDFTEHEIPVGFVGPHIVAEPRSLPFVLAVDPDVAQDQFWASGANEVDHHVKHFHWRRDVLERLDESAKQRVIVADIRNAMEGDPSPKEDGGVLRESKGIEIGHVFKLGRKYTEALDVHVLDEQQRQVRPIMGCYGIGVNRIIASAIEREGGHDEHGVIWPVSIAPYQVVITPIKYEGRACEVANELYGELEEKGVDVLLDDREERPGVKFKDADLIGIPLRIVVGEKGLADEQVEFKPRTAAKAEMVKLDQAIERTLAFLNP